LNLAVLHEENKTRDFFQFNSKNSEDSEIGVTYRSQRYGIKL
jgi:hypothetical protein